jgi:hypothetical protein
MKKSISTAQTPANIAAVLSLLEAMPRGFRQLSATLSPAELRAPIAPGERSPTEILAHLIHCEIVASDAIYLAILLDEPLMPPLHAERDWGALLHHEDAEFDELLAYFSFRRVTLLRVLNGLSEAQWARAIREADKQRKESVYWRARALALHEEEHLRDAQAKLAAHQTKNRFGKS